MPEDRPNTDPQNQNPTAPEGEREGRDLPLDELSRRGFLRLGALAGAGASLGAMGAATADADPGESELDLGLRGFHLQEATIAEMQAAMESGQLTSKALVNWYRARIRTKDRPNSVLELNTDAPGIARELDRERRIHGPRGPLHGIPVLLKDNIDTGDAMQTAAGSLALVGTPALQDSTVAARLRAAGAVILGKANLSEWANFRGFSSSSGWSGRGGQCRNPYVLDRNPCGSSSGSAAAVSGNLTAVALGTETDGSIVCPAHACGVVGIKPTVGLTSRAGVVPISSTQDTVGPHGRTVADAAAVLGALTGVDPRDPATQASAGHFFTDYTQFLDEGGLAGARIGVARQLAGFSEEADEVFEEAIAAMADAGAVIIDPVLFPSFDAFNNDDSEIIVLVYEFKRDLNAYLATRTGVPVADMADVIAFNLAHFDDELAFFGQQWFELAEAEIFTQQEYEDALVRGPMLAGEQGIDAVMDADNLDAIIAPTGSPAWPSDLINGDAFLGGSSGYAAVAGYPLVSMPAGYIYELPVGITFMGRAFSEPTLIRVASGFEAATGARRKPRFRPTLPLGIPGGHPVQPRAAGRSARELLEEVTARTRFSGLRPRYL